MKRKSKIEEDLLYELVKNYNLTIEQFYELNNERNYHKMIDYKYYWNIVYYVNKDLITKQMGLKHISAILANADGHFSYDDREICFYPEYNLTDYIKYSSSLVIINNDKPKGLNKLDPVMASIEEEIEIIKSCLSKINKTFGRDVIKDVFYYKYILGIQALDIQKILKISKNRYYHLLKMANELGYKAFGLYTDQEIKRMTKCI